MHLTAPTPLDPANVHIDAYDLANSVISIRNPSPLASLRWGNVNDTDMINYLTALYSAQILKAAEIPRIGALQNDAKGNTVERREHLVIRDLDLLPLLVEQKPNDFKDIPAATKLGRIIAHADYRFRPKGWDWQNANPPYRQANGRPIGISAIPKPPGANVELIELFDTMIEELLSYHCKSQDCYELVNISTSATHLRKGLARQLVMWLYRFCDEAGLDYKLIASPMGRGLYKGCGFAEEGEGEKWAVEIDMGRWGGEGIHQHVYMVRHPETSAS